MATRLKFTDRYIDKTLKPKSARYEILEGDGFTIRVTPAGVKTFYYVYKFHGKNKRLHLGGYPHTTLAEAREAHRQALSLRKNGQDPVAVRQELEAAREEEVLRLQNEKSIDQLADYYIEEHAKPNKKSWKEDERILNHDVRPAWGDLPARAIRKRDVIKLMETIAKRGAPQQSTKTFKIVRRMFNFAIDRGILENTPCSRIKPLVKSTSKERWLDDNEIRTFWAFLEDPTSSRLCQALRCAFRLILITAQRPGECLGLPWTEIDGRWWTLPVERSKNDLENRTFLTDLAQEQILANDSAFVFPSPRQKKSGEAPLGENAAAHALWKLLQPHGPSKITRLPIAPFTPHDLRRTAATHLGQLGYEDAQIGRLLNHTEGTVTSIYNRHKYDGLIQEMLQAWDARLREILAA